MQILYIIFMGLLIITMFVESFCIYEQRHFSHKYRNKIKPVCDFICVLLLCAISVIGCIATLNINTYFLVVYIAVYFFVKEIYSALISNRRDKSIKIKLQSYVETKITFNELFVYDSSKKEKEKRTTWWIRRYLNNDKKESIGILLNGERHYYILQREEFSNSIDYVINQIFEYAKDIKNKEDLCNLELFVITDNDMAEDYANNFIPHNNCKPIKNPIIYKDTMFNMVMLSGYITGNSLINIINSWSTISLAEKILNILFGGMFAISFIAGLIALPVIIYESLKKTTK